MYSYKLYQMPMSNISKFRSFDKTKENIKLSDYVLVYCGKLEYNEEDFLDEIFYILNMKRPKDFYGYSMSVSDVLYIYDEETNYEYGYYYCDDLGWVKLNKERFLK